MGCALAIVFSGPLPLRFLILSLLSRVHFGESLVIRLYSGIDHTYLSIEAQCVSHHYPRWTATLIIPDLSVHFLPLVNMTYICTLKVFYDGLICFKTGVYI